MSFKVTWKMHLICILISFAICIAMKNYIDAMITYFIVENSFVSSTGNLLIYLTLYFLIIFVPITFVHEILHGISYKCFGGKVKYGFKGMYAYSQEVSGIVLHRTKFVVVLLAPVTLISIISLIIPYNIGSVIFFLNLLGSTGDLFMAFYICRTDKNSYIVDKIYGFDVVKKIE